MKMEGNTLGLPGYPGSLYDSYLLLFLVSFELFLFGKEEQRNTQTLFHPLSLIV